MRTPFEIATKLLEFNNNPKTPKPLSIIFSF